MPLSPRGPATHAAAPPPACSSKPANFYCIHCSSTAPTACVADGGVACLATYKASGRAWAGPCDLPTEVITLSDSDSCLLPAQGSPAIIQTCASFEKSTQKDGKCFKYIKKSGVQLNLAHKDKLLSQIEALACPGELPCWQALGCTSAEGELGPAENGMRKVSPIPSSRRSRLQSQRRCGLHPLGCRCVLRQPGRVRGRRRRQDVLHQAPYPGLRSGQRRGLCHL